MDDTDWSWGLGDYGSTYSDDSGYLGGDDSSWNASDVDANSPWTDYTGFTGGDGGTSTGGGSGSGSDYWTRWLAQAGLSAAGGYFQGQAQAKLSKEDAAARMALMLATKAEDEKYYQLHGKQLQDAYAKYKPFYSKPTDHGPNNPTALFGMLAPRTDATAAVNGFAYDPEGLYPDQQQPSTGIAAPFIPQGHSTHGR